MWNILIFIIVLLHLASSFVPQTSLQRKTNLYSSLTNGFGHLYRDEPNELERELINKEEHNPKHSSFHVEHGIESVDDKTDPSHSVHHHLIDVDRNKLKDLDMRAQKAWLPVEVHEMNVDAVTVLAACFAALALILFTVPQ